MPATQHQLRRHPLSRFILPRRHAGAARLQEGWVIANHILVSFHVAFISSVLALPPEHIVRSEVLRFIFLSPETLASALYVYLTFHAGVALHELGHYLAAARLNALNDRSQREAAPVLTGSFATRAVFLARQFVLAPYGRASGIKREGLNYYPDAPYNLAVAAAGPRASRNVALAMLPPAVILLTVGLAAGIGWAVYAGRLCLGIGVVGLLDFLLADPGKYAEFKQREQTAREKAGTVTRDGDWWGQVEAVKHRLLSSRLQQLTHPLLGAVQAPWQFRNCGMGGRHTEKEYPESNVSMQEAMFLILGAGDYQEAQEMTVRLQNRLKEVIEQAEGCRVMGIGLEGGLAPYIERGRYPLPEVRLWAMMKQTIEECGYRPGTDVAIALDPAMTELEIAYRQEFNLPDSVGMYLFWRDRAQAVLDRDGVLALYQRAMQEYDIPILSIEDGFSEDDHEGWQNLLRALGERIFVIGDDLVTTNDETIELAAREGLINTALIKANQIGTLLETILAMLVALGKGHALVVSHRSKSPNDDMEAQIALAVNALGMKCGGGANTERLVKYQAVNELMQKGAAETVAATPPAPPAAVVDRVFAYEEPTNAGIPSVGATVELRLEGAGLGLRFRGATPLGTSAGTGEAIHLVDADIEGAEYREVIGRHGALFRETEPGVYRFQKDLRAAQVRAQGDDGLTALYERAQRYDGKGCLAAVENVATVIAPVLEGLPVSELGLADIDRSLLSLELALARRRGKLAEDADQRTAITVMQRKQNLGMNAILSVSLAMARGLAHLQGKALYELLREEACAIIDRLAAAHQVTVRGSQFADYVTALREVNDRLDAENRPLYVALREVTEVYRPLDAAALRSRPSGPESARPEPGETAPADAPAPSEAVVAAVTAVEAPETAERPTASEPLTAAEQLTAAELPDADGRTAAVAEAPVVPVGGAAPTPTAETLSEHELEEILAINLRLRELCHAGAESATRKRVLRRYLALKQSIARRTGTFGIVNNRIFHRTGELVVPYLVGRTLMVFRAPAESDEPIFRQLWNPGTILTDALLKRLVGFEGEALDLEQDLDGFDDAAVGPVRVGRIRDMAEQVRVISRSASRAEAVYILRFLVARLSLFSFRKFLSAKNIQSEVRSLVAELQELLNTPLFDELPLLVRILVRNISGGVTKPKLIDHLWNDSIDLAEVHVRGSDIVNEIRRSTHHAIGRGTQALASAYLAYLSTGDTEGLARQGYAQPGPADEQARTQEKPRELVARLVENLEALFGSSEIVGRVREWQQKYADTLLRCDFGKSVAAEAEEVIAEGIAAGNRWAYFHHLRILKGRVALFPRLAETGDETGEKLAELLARQPDAASFDAAATEAELRATVESFVTSVEAEYQAPIFKAIDACIASYEAGEHLPTYGRLFELRRFLRDGLAERAFPEQRLLLLELDCLLEEMGFLALRQVSSRYEQEGVDIGECLGIIRHCALNLSHDGLHSRQLRDLVDMLADGALTHRELGNILGQVQRNYHHILRRLLDPFETMRETLDLEPDELRIALANMQRFLHDLNSMVAFTDLALAYVDHHVGDRDAPVHATPPPAAAQRAPGAQGIVHLSHTPAVRALVEDLDPDVNLRRRYGGKGSGLIYISYLGVPTRDGFVLPVPPPGQEPGSSPWSDAVIDEHLATLEDDIARRDGRRRRFGGGDEPLLLAVRGGSVFSMPGILATVLFVGMNDEVTATLAARDPWHAYDSYRRFLASYAQGVWQVDVEKHSIVEQVKRRYGVRYKLDLPWEGMQEIAEATKQVLRDEGLGEALEEILADPRRQLRSAIAAVHASWHGETAQRYRAIKDICASWQSAVVVQEMASGNRSNPELREGMDETRTSLTGVVPRTVVSARGGRECIGEFKFSAAGEDLVGGLSTAISLMPIAELAAYLPMLDRRVRHTTDTLRRFMGTDQEIEFTVDQGVLSVLQSRAAEIGANRDRFTFVDAGPSAAHGIGVRGSAFRGLVVFAEEDFAAQRQRVAAQEVEADGVILLLENPTPDDIPLILAADALLAAKGGSTSHAAVAINGLGGRDYHAVVGAGALRVDGREKAAAFLDAGGIAVQRLGTGDVISIDGATGAVYPGPLSVERL